MPREGSGSAWVGSAASRAAPCLEDLASFLDRVLPSPRVQDDPAGIWKGGRDPVHRLGLALEPFPALRGWAEAHALDAVFLHRPWRLAGDGLPERVGVLAYHQRFDLHLSVGRNPYLAADLELEEVEPIGCASGECLGMVGALPEQSWPVLLARTAALFGGVEDTIPPQRRGVRRVAVAGAMTDALVREAASAGADAYLTGQMRVPGRAAAAELGLAVIATGHARAERWGLRTLGRLLTERWPALQVVHAP